MKCNNCQVNEAINHPIYGILNCQPCQDNQPTLKRRRSPRFYSVNKLHRVQGQQDRHISDLEQPYIGNKPNETFAKLYPEQAEEMYSKKELNRL